MLKMLAKVNKHSATACAEGLHPIGSNSLEDLKTAENCLFVVNLMTLSVAQTTKCRMVG
jgi:hypothetical protein